MVEMIGKFFKVIYCFLLKCFSFGNSIIDPTAMIVDYHMYIVLYFKIYIINILIKYENS